MPKIDSEDLRVGGSERREGSTWAKWLALTPKCTEFCASPGNLSSKADEKILTNPRGRLNLINYACLGITPGGPRQIKRASEVPAQEIALDSASATLFHLVIVLHLTLY